MRFGLRARVVAAIVLVTTTATAVMTYFAYQIQMDDTDNRYRQATEFVAISDSQVMNGELGQIAAGSDDVEGLLDRAARNVRFIAGLEWTIVSVTTPGQVFRIVRPRPGDSRLDGLNNPAPSLQHTQAVLEGVAGDILVPAEGPYNQRSAITTDPASGRRLLAVSITFFQTPYLFVEFFDLGKLDTDLATLRWKLVWVASGVSVLGVGAALLIARRIRRPILGVSEAAKELGGGALDVRVPVKGRDEVADLARSFNAMAQRLGESIEQQRRFVADVAHDLRTPLASMVAVVDNLDNATPATRTRATEILGTQARRLARLVEDLLEIAQFDAGKADLRTETVDLRALVADAAEVSDVDDLGIIGDATVVADPRRIHTVVSNLLTNAVRHGAAPITASITSTESAVTLEVRDSGPGVPEDLLPILFDRFVRGDRARQASDGSGLGLSIARENTLAHGGTLTVHNESGAVFTLTLPRHTVGTLNSD
jgi:two-component system sensor histidine kinase MtrB